MTDRSWQHTCVEQFDAVEDLSARYGLKVALHYAVGEKPLPVANAGTRHRDIARTTPRFVFPGEEHFSRRGHQGSPRTH